MTNKKKYFELLTGKKSFWIGGLIIVAVFGFLLFSSYGLFKSIKLSSERYDRIDEKIELKKLNDSLRKKIKQLKIDTLEIERVAREKYGMIEPGEKIYIQKNIEEEE